MKTRQLLTVLHYHAKIKVWGIKIKKVIHSHPISSKTPRFNLIYCSKKRLFVKHFHNPSLQFLLAVIHSASLEANTANLKS
jgi:hypothetical protein